MNVTHIEWWLRACEVRDAIRQMLLFGELLVDMGQEK